VKELLTSFTLKVLGSFFTLFLAAMLFGNTILLYVSIVPLLVAVFALIFDTPGSVNVVRKEDKLSAWVNGTVEISVKITADKGVGIITATDPLPEHFEIVEGNNFRVLWKGFGKLSEELHYRVRCTKRGIYRVGPTKYECRHISSLRQTEISVGQETTELIVRQKPLNIRRLRDPKVVSRIPMPLGSTSKLGMMTTDFKEIREYCYGDSYRHINWKATARASSPMRNWPLVNEFEREGKKVAWIFLDGSASMATGTNIENAFEYAVQAVLGLSQFYLARNCHVGLYVYNDEGEMLLPDTGRRQEYKIYRTTLGLEVSTTKEPLKKAVSKCRGHLTGANPFSIIITDVQKENLQELLEGIKELKKYSKSLGRQPQILVLHVNGYSVAARGYYENAGVAMLDLRNQAALRALRRAGVFVTPWNPKRESLASLMVLGVQRR
jgi:uncharacterized protein (DUF58 family)